MTFRALSLGLALAAAPLAATADPLRILAFGDSLTAGYGLAPEDGLVGQLQSWLTTRGHDVLIVNGGVSGDTTSDGRARIGETILRDQPDAVIVELGGNDLLMGRSPKEVEDNLDAVLDQIGASKLPVLLVGIAAPTRDARLRRDWADIWPRLAQRHDTLLLENLYGPFFTLTKRELAHALQQDHVHASKAGVAMIVEALGPQVEALIEQTEARGMAVGG